MQSRWFSPLSPPTRAAPRVYCFPHAGASTLAFAPLARELSPHVGVWSASLPGRGPRHGEPPLTDLVRLVSSLADAVECAGAHPFAFLGHSMGAIVSFEVARELRRRDAALPVALVASAARAPHLFAAGRRPSRDLDAADLVARLRRLGGIPAQVLACPELVAHALPALRADLSMCDAYRYEPEQPLAVEIVALSGGEDPTVSVEEAATWCEHGDARSSIRAFAGGHFFIEAHWRTVAQLVERLLGRPAAGEGGRGDAGTPADRARASGTPDGDPLDAK